MLVETATQLGLNWELLENGYYFLLYVCNAISPALDLAIPVELTYYILCVYYYLVMEEPKTIYKLLLVGSGGVCN
jgi:hypothetical protein